MFYTVYKITNLINGKLYIGAHKTKNLDDGYMGSGTYLKRAIKKHGLENFYKQILFVFDNPKDMYAKEMELVDEDFLSAKNTYNLKIGGFGGFDYINKNDKCFGGPAGRLILSKKGNNALQLRRQRDPIFAEIQNERLREIGKIGAKNSPKFKGKSHTDEVKRSIGSKNAIHQKGSKNSQYGTMWITNGTENMKIKKEFQIPDGWYKGRIHRQVCV